jgi:GT2 family glycosyltransferase
VEARPRLGAASGKLFRTGEGATVLDSAGILMKRHRGAYDRGEGAPDLGQFDSPCEVFAASGAALFARRAALDDAAGPDGPFDEAFFMYKEELDLCWRLRLRGWSCWYVPAAVAWHDRTSSSLAGRSFASGARDYWRVVRSRPPHVRLHSLKNQWLMLIKDDEARALVRAPGVVVRELVLFAVTVVSAPRVAARSVVAFGRALPGALRERRRIQRGRTVPRGALAGWFRE